MVSAFLKWGYFTVEMPVLGRLKFLLTPSPRRSGLTGVNSPRQFFIKTEDNWRLAVYHYKRSRSRRAPVLLIHGLGTNRFDLDFVDPQYSLAQYLYQRGYDVWLFEYRGAGKSYRPGILQYLKDCVQPDWIVDDIVFTDIPTMVRHVQEATGFQKIHFIGHSLGGMLLYMVLMTMGNQVCQSAVTLGASMNSTARPGWIRLVLKLDWLLERFPLIPTKLLFRLGSPFVSWVAPLEDNHFYSIKNITPSLLQKASRYATENVPMALFMELHRWYKKGHFEAEQRDFSFHNHLKDIKTPMLVIAGSVDGITPLPDVRYAYDKISSRDKKFVIMGTPGGYAHEYAHMDLILGTRAPKEVYPQILRWLKTHDPKER